MVELIYFPDTRVRGKHSAWQSTAPNRAEARIHHPQKNGSQKPSYGRKGDRDSGGRSLRNFKVRARFIVTHSPSVACGDNSLPEGAFRKFTSIEKHHQRKFLGGVRVFSAKVAEAMGCFCFVWLRGWDLNLAFLHFLCGENAAVSSAALTCHRQVIHSPSPSELFALRTHNPVFVRSYPLARKTKAPPFRTVLCFVWLRRWDLNLTTSGL